VISTIVGVMSDDYSSVTHFSRLTS